jgi:TonB family protein
MIAAWMIYAVAVSVPVALCSWGAARLLRRYNVAERYVWIGGLVLALAIPAFQLLPERAPDVSSGPLASAAIVIDLGLPDTVGVAGDGLLARASALAAWGWLVLSLVLGIRIGTSWWTLARARSRWTRVNLVGANVFLTDDVGPAVFGVVRPRIVLPRWMRGLPATQLDDVVRHEIEHVRAKDPLALAAVLALRIALPWHPGVWFLTGGLLEAIEVDCDRRVLRARRDVRTYGETVLTVAARMRPGPRQPVAAFSEPVHSIRRRLMAMTQPQRTMSRVGMLALAAVGVVALVGACETPLPSKPEQPLQPETPAATEDDSGDPAVIAVAPGEASEDSTVSDVTEEGTVAPDEGLEEEPVEIGIPPRSGELEDDPDAGPAPGPEDPDPSQGPVLTPHTKPPRLRNLAEVQAALESEYPRELKDARVGGDVNVWLFIDTNGVVQSTRIETSSGYSALDQAALNVARAIQFTPAMNMDRTVPVWILIPISFQVP